MIMKRTHDDSVIDVVYVDSPILGDSGKKVLQIMLLSNSSNHEQMVIVEYIDRNRIHR